MKATVFSVLLSIATTAGYAEPDRCEAKSAAAAATITHKGRVWVIDGDTIAYKNTGLRIRLWGLNAPELGDHIGQNAKTKLAKIIGHHEVSCADTGQRSYDRVVARCFIGRTDLSAIMITQGLAKPYCHFSGDFYDNVVDPSQSDRKCGKQALHCP